MEYEASFPSSMKIMKVERIAANRMNSYTLHDHNYEQDIERA